MFFVNLHKRLYWDEGEKNQASLCCKLNFDRIVRTEQKQHNQKTKISIKINKYSKNKYVKLQVSKSPLKEILPSAVGSSCYSFIQGSPYCSQTQLLSSYRFTNNKSSLMQVHIYATAWMQFNYPTGEMQFSLFFYELQMWPLLIYFIANIYCIYFTTNSYLKVTNIKYVNTRTHTQKNDLVLVLVPGLSYMGDHRWSLIGFTKFIIIL